MSARDDIAALYADETLDEAQRRAAIYRIKTAALLDVIANGAGPRACLVERTYAHKGVSYLINRAWAGPQDQLIFDVVVGGMVHQVIIVNPPLIPRAPTGDERADMMTAVMEMLEDLPTEDVP